MKQIIEIDDDLQKALNEYFEGKRSYVGLDNGVKLLEAVKNGKEIKDDISLSEEPNKSENSNSSTTKNDLGVDKTFYEQIVEYCNEHFLILVEKDVWEDARKALITKNNGNVNFSVFDNQL